jgi:hypothetical protein
MLQTQGRISAEHYIGSFTACTSGWLVADFLGTSRYTANGYILSTHTSALISNWRNTRMGHQQRRNTTTRDGTVFTFHKLSFLFVSTRYHYSALIQSIVTGWIHTLLDGSFPLSNDEAEWLSRLATLRSMQLGRCLSLWFSLGDGKTEGLSFLASVRPMQLWLSLSLPLGNSETKRSNLLTAIRFVQLWRGPRLSFDSFGNGGLGGKTRLRRCRRR